MNTKLEERCKRQLKNEHTIRQMSTLDSEESVKLGSLLYTALGITAEDEKIAECRKILQSKTAFFSNLRGVLQSLLLLKMSIAEDSESYIDGVIDTYDKLTKDNDISGLFSILTSIIIFDDHGDKEVNAVISQVLDMFNEVKETNPEMSHNSDMAYIALMLLSGKADLKIEEEKKLIFNDLINAFHLSPDAAQASTLVLITGTKPVEEKLRGFVGLYNALKESGHATSLRRCISIYAAFTDIDVPREELAALISEADQFLKTQKGYSVFSVSTDFRKVIAATLALQYCTIDIPAEQSDSDFSVPDVISIESLLFIVLMSIVSLS